MPWNLPQYFPLQYSQILSKCIEDKEKPDTRLPRDIFFLLIVLKVRFSRKMGSAEFFYFFPHRKKMWKENKICHNSAVGKFTWQTDVANELIFFHNKLWVETTNHRHPYTRFEIWKKNFSAKLCITQEIRTRMFWDYEHGRVWPF